MVVDSESDDCSYLCREVGGGGQSYLRQPQVRSQIRNNKLKPQSATAFLGGGGGGQGGWRGGVYMETPVEDKFITTESLVGARLDLLDVGTNQEPNEGMSFESDEAAKAFYDEYARRIGFLT
ncbi:hypothetical protein RHMOL_Rhmol02G0087300 [Rhododendron molle]|uniref:Uncharacterized protein n=1 Tax=Rhododendron molle TaxID=49168 RepID=A0ACC0PPQ5_RHOML|nr:hypothetical protein RHMOL_Rhmol02G0087300 [Rhododendron molle]